MSNEAKHTPGPWGIERTDSHNWIGPIRKNSHKIAEIVCSTERGPLKEEVLAESDANARLISAAPDLLEALKNLIHEIRAYSSPECDDEGAIGAPELKAADAAIAKAEGRTA